MLIPTDHFPRASHIRYFDISRKLFLLYLLAIITFAGVLASLPFLYLDISITAPGIIRPIQERTEIRSSIPGFIHQLNFKEGDFVRKGSILASLERQALDIKQSIILNKQAELKPFMKDLGKLLRIRSAIELETVSLETPLYRRQVDMFRNRIAEQQVIVNHSTEALNMNRILLEGKVIALKEFSDVADEHARLKAILNTIFSSQQAAWEKELLALKKEYNESTFYNKQLQLEQPAYLLIAPVSGIIQLPATRYTGNFIQAGETFCIISPESDLIAECILPGKDIAMVKTATQVNFKIDAFNYTYFGMLSGKILSIDKDFTLYDNKPVFKVRCSFMNKEIKLPNGYRGKLQKGLTLQASFVITRRTIWQLLTDKIAHWVDPKNQNAFQ